MEILNHIQVGQKIDRLAYQILENNFQSQQIVFAGINNNGLTFAKKLKDVYDSISDKASIIGNIRLNPAAPLESGIEIDIDLKTLNDKCVIIVDDVANTGRTIFYATKPLMEYLPKKIEAAVLVDRKHKMFPIQVDYVGLSLATTLKENIKVKLSSTQKMSVALE